MVIFIAGKEKWGIQGEMGWKVQKGKYEGSEGEIKERCEIKKEKYYTTERILEVGHPGTMLPVT